MKKLIFISILTIAVSMGTFAQDKSADLKKLFDVMQSEKMVDEMMNSIIPVMKQQAVAQLDGEENKEKFNKYMDFMMNEVKELTNKLINEEMVQIYDKHFEQNEIKDMIAFYESSTGKKMLEKTPEITKDLMTSMMSKHLPEFQNKLIQQLEELKK